MHCKLAFKMILHGTIFNATKRAYKFSPNIIVGAKRCKVLETKKKPYNAAATNTFELKVVRLISV